ncbi:MAG: hypothetical protein ACP5XB_23765 [Isosphaeraceae bacterium]
MRALLATLIVLCAVVAQGALDAPKATGTLHGKHVKFPENVVAEGVNTTVSLLESCCSESLFEPDELRKAVQGDHIRLVFPGRGITSEVMDKKISHNLLAGAARPCA